MRYLFLTALIAASTATAALAGVRPDLSVTNRVPDVVPDLPPKSPRMEPPPLEGAARPDPSDAARACSAMAGENAWSLSSRATSGGFNLECSITLPKPDHE